MEELLFGFVHIHPMNLIEPPELATILTDYAI